MMCTMCLHVFNKILLSSRYSVAISDSDPVNSFVAQFVATDGDHGADGIISYSIASGNDDGFFTINSFGEVTVARSPIHSTTYSMVISAQDRGMPSNRATAQLTVRVIATQAVDCLQLEFDRPVISSESDSLVAPVGTDVRLTCDYSANPIVTIYKWTQQDSNNTIFDSTEHYTLNQYSMEIHDLTVADAGVFSCNVTNQCGFATVTHLVTIIGELFSMNVNYFMHIVLLYVYTILRRSTNLAIISNHTKITFKAPSKLKLQ